MVQDPRGFLLPRFVNVGRHLMAANVVLRHTSKNLQETGLSLQVRYACVVRAKADIYASVLKFAAGRQEKALFSN